MSLLAKYFVALAIVSAPLAIANPLLYTRGLDGFIVLAEQRFDPAVQRLMAQRSLRALPLRDGLLYYVFPTQTSNAYIEQMQIRYLEAMLEKKSKSVEPTEQ